MSRMWDIVAVIVGLLGVLFVANSLLGVLTGFSLTIMTVATIVAIGGLIVYALRSIWN